MAPVAHQPLRMLFLPPVEKSAPPYMPEPVPAPTSMLVGAHHCPLWEADKPEMWLNVLKHPERTPALGLYSQENPEVSDWETKWAVEHGISFFAFDWYYDHHTGRVSEYNAALDEGFLKARYNDRMKFAVMWANHKPFSSHTREQLLTVTDYWIEHYLRRPNYLTIDGKPYVIFYHVRFRAEAAPKAQER